MLPKRTEGRRKVRSVSSDTEDANWETGGEARRDAPSGGKKRQNESPHDQERGSKAMKLSNPSSQDRFDSMWTSGRLQLQKGRLDTISGISQLGGGRERPNMVSQFVGPISDQDASVLAAYRLAASRSATGETLLVHIPIHRDPDPTSSTSGGLSTRAHHSGPRKLFLSHLTQRPKQLDPWASSARSLPAPSTRSSVRGDKVDRAAKGKGKAAEVVDLTKATDKPTKAKGDRSTKATDKPTKATGDKATEAEPVYLTVLNDATLCDICRKTGSHTTGRCGMVTSTAHGDTNTDPFCNISASFSRNGPGQHIHALQGPQKGDFKIACPAVKSCWDNYDVQHVWRKLVLERRRMPPLAAYTEEFCFVGLTIVVSTTFFDGEMPPEMDGIWPYTKADAVKYEKECEKFWETGMENMPRGELEGLTMAEVRQAYENGKIMAQVRHEKSAKMKRKALVPSGLTRSLDGDGDLQMDGTTSSSLSKRVGLKHRVRREDVLEDSELAAEAQDEEQSARRIGRSKEKVRPRRQITKVPDIPG